MYPKKIPEYIVPFYSEETEFTKGSKDVTDISIHENCNIGMHYHDFYEINIVTNGTGCHYIGDMAIPLICGEIFVIPPGVLHGYYCEKQLDVCHIILKSDFMKMYGEQLSAVPGYSALFEIEPYLRQVYDDNPIVRFNEKKLSWLKRELSDIMSADTDEYISYRAIQVLHLIADMCRYTQSQRNHQSINEKHQDILTVLEYIQNNYSEHISIETLMKIVNMSRPTLHRHFKDVTKTTPLEYIIKCRVNAAQALLAQGELSRTEIAQRCGFFDTSHMSKHINKGQ